MLVVIVIIIFFINNKIIMMEKRQSTRHKRQVLKMINLSDGNLFLRSDFFALCKNPGRMMMRLFIYLSIAQQEHNAKANIFRLTARYLSLLNSISITIQVYLIQSISVFIIIYGCHVR